MNTFLQRHESSVTGMLSGFDRLRFRGTLRLLANAGGMRNFLWQAGVLLKDFKAYVMEITTRLRESVQQIAERAARPVKYLPSSSLNKEAVARKIAADDNIREGLICVLSCVELCRSYQIHRNRHTQKLDLQNVSSKCLHYYFYYFHPRLGFMHARLQSWFPFDLRVCCNGREWLARSLDHAGMGYLRRDNCLVAVEDRARAQQHLDRQLKTDWPRLLDAIAQQVYPLRRKLLAKCPVDYYWSLDESEWASDVMFRSSRALAALYPRLVRHAISTFGSREVMRFLGRKVPAEGLYRAGEVVSDLRSRPEGMRVKHRINRNSIKMYDKQGSVLRVETTINDPREMKVFRPKEGDEEGRKSWRYLRKGVADVHRRAEICQAANERYLEGLAAAEENTPLATLSAPLCKRTRWKGKSVRALNPLASEDAALLAAVSRGEFLLHGFRNRDLQPCLYGTSATTPEEKRRRSAAVTRKLRLLRAHGLIRKLSHTHRYQLTEKGRVAITALLAAANADITKLSAA
jgi:hypothetical protein